MSWLTRRSRPGAGADEPAIAVEMEQHQRLCADIALDRGSPRGGAPAIWKVSSYWSDQNQGTSAETSPAPSMFLGAGCARPARAS